MSTDISQNTIKLTQETLGVFVKKPPLSEKLLKKPPFRFLHDIVTAIIKNTGFLDGLFTDEELNSENVKDRDSKIAFLQKVIDVVSIVTDSSLSVRPSKVIAGLEPEKTNELLQKIGLALQNNLSSHDAVKSVITKNDSKKLVKTSSVTSVNESKKLVKTLSVTSTDEPKKKENDSKKSKKNDEQKSKISKSDKTVTNVGSKAKTNPVLSEKKVSKDRNKTDKNSTNDKTKSKSSAKSEPVKKSTKNSLSNTKINSIEALEESENSFRKLENVSEEANIQNILRNEGFGGRVVELKDIIDDYDDLNSKSLDINSIELEEPKPAERTVSPNIPTENTTQNASAKPIRPQSRLSRQRNALLQDNNEVDTIPKNTVNQSNVDFKLNNNNENVQNNEKHEIEETQETIVTNNVVGEVKSQTSRITTGKKSSKTRREPIKVSHSISLETKSEDTSNQKSLSSDTETKDQSLPKTTLRPPSVRPSSARPGAPRLRDRNSDVLVNVSEPVVIGKVHVIVENYDNQPEDDEGSVEVMQVAPDDNIINSESVDVKQDISGGHGHLVQQILETQKELANEDTSRVEIEWEYGARREREVSHGEIEGIRNGLQSLSRASNPMGKLMDYIQEDVEIMRLELLQWRDTCVRATAQLREQQRLTEQQIQPLESKLRQLENSISEQTELIHTVKANIHRNAYKIIKMVEGED